MHCFICVTYMIILCSAHPPRDRELSDTHQKRSLFRDVIESFRIRAQLPDNLNQNDENNLGQNYERYGYENELPNLPSDADFIPRRNDRIEMPPLKYRFPKSLSNDTEEKGTNITTEEFVVFIDTSSKKPTKSTPKSKVQKRPPVNNKKRPSNKENENEEAEEETQTQGSNLPFSNSMTGQSQIGDRESQTVVKPTVIVNFRGTLSHRDSDIKLESKNDNDTGVDPVRNIFNINQEVRFDNKKSGKPTLTSVKDQLNMLSNKNKAKVEEDMLMCETATWNPPTKVRGSRKDNVLQILFTI